MLTAKQNIVHHVCDTAMRILHESYLPNTNLWPMNGFKAGWGIGCNIKDRIYYGVNAYGWDQTPVKGVLGFNIWNTTEPRRKKQLHHIRTILDYAFAEEIYYEDTCRQSTLTVVNDQYIFTFTYTPKN